MSGFAHAVVNGRITGNLELKTSTNGKVFMPFTVAYDSGKDSTTFLPCMVFGKTAEIIQKYHQKGYEITLIGKLEGNDREKDGVVYKGFTLKVSNFEFENNKKQDDRPIAQHEVIERTRDVAPTDVSDEPISLQDIPF